MRASFDIDEFLARPLTARVATAGPTIRPTWYLWEGGAFWILTGPWGKLADHVDADPRLAVSVDVCDIESGLVRLVVAQGDAEIRPFDVPRGRRKLSRYLGDDEGAWDPRFRAYLHDASATAVWVRMQPTSLRARDLSYAPSG